jgi:hypothetical protein
MPRKERPAALSDSIFRAKLESLQSKAPNDDPIVSEEIPVHNTFIQFGAHQEGDAFGTKPLSTAPAWVGPSPRNALQSELQSAVDQASLQQSDDQKTDLAIFSHDSPKSQDVATCSSSSKPLASPKKVSVMRTSPAGVTMCSDEEEEEAKAETQEEAEDDTVATSLGAATSEELPSVGSAKHAEGLCKRCCFFPKGRCSNGYGCEFCHLEHEKRNREKKEEECEARHV